MTAKSRQRYDTLDLLLFLFCCLSFASSERYLYLTIFSHANEGVLGFVPRRFFFCLVYYLFMITSLSKRVLIVMAGFWQGRREGVIEAGEFILFFLLLFSSLLLDLGFN